MKTFQEFMSICEEVEDKSKALGFAATIKRARAGGRIGAERKKTTPERRRMKAVGGGKMEPVEYKPRKDIGQQRQASTRVQQPEKERGSKEVAQSYAEKVKAERRKAAQARIAAKKGGEAPAAEKPKAKEVAKTASQLLAKKKKATVSPDYKPQKASGLSAKERNKQTREGERMLRGIMKQQETEKYEKATGEKPKGKAKTKILAHVEKRMAN